MFHCHGVCPFWIFLAGNEHDQAWRQCGSTAWPEGGVPWCFPQLMDAMMRLRWLAGIIHKCPSFGHFVFLFAYQSHQRDHHRQPFCVKI